MEEKKVLVEELFEKAVAYGETSIELLKLKAIDKTSDKVSGIVSRIILAIVFGMFLLIFSIGVSFWIGAYMDETYYGFMIVAAFYLLLALLLIMLHPSIKKQIANSVISHFLK